MRCVYVPRGIRMHQKRVRVREKRQKDMKRL